jgi:hypothetical protein
MGIRKENEQQKDFCELLIEKLKSVFDFDGSALPSDENCEAVKGIYGWIQSPCVE